MARKTLSEKEKREKLAQIKLQRTKDSQPVKGIFRFNEVPGGGISFCYKAYKGDPVERYDLIDGQVYTVPLGVARHLNRSGKYPVHAYSVQENGKADMRIGKMVSRYGFQSLEFIDIGDADTTGTSEIEQVTFIDKK